MCMAWALSKCWVRVGRCWVMLVISTLSRSARPPAQVGTTIWVFHAKLWLKNMFGLGYVSGVCFRGLSGYVSGYVSRYSGYVS